MNYRDGCEKRNMIAQVDHIENNVDCLPWSNVALAAHKCDETDGGTDPRNGGLIYVSCQSESLLCTGL
jgi:hypothetical protein